MRKLALVVLALGSVAAHAQQAPQIAQGAAAFDDTKVCRYGDSYYTEGARIKATDGSRLLCEEKDHILMGDKAVSLHWVPIVASQKVN
ncbi:hypothetical protein PTKU15_10710 [Paraburkholderia terrae]|nr:hypothetical protein PTKU15_10710 [Paraburkholderia terrae]